MKIHLLKPIASVCAAVLLISSAAALPVSGAESADTTAALSDFYEDWKARYLTQDLYVTDETQYYVRYSDAAYSGSGSVAVTVSEAHGYGMLIAACMDDAEAFAGMTRYYLAHLSDIGPHLMSWQQCDNGTALIDGAAEGSDQPGEADSATDGDMDIAYAFLLADMQWGSDGAFQYRQLAEDMIGDIMEYEVNHRTWTLNLGDWCYWEEPGSEYDGATRSSDFIMQYLPVFAQVTEDSRWMQVYDSTYAIIDSFVETYGTGLLPDFIIPGEDGSYVPAPADFLEDTTDGMYAYNSCRTPWRIGMDALMNQNETALKLTRALNAFITEAAGGDPANITAGYTLDGQSTADYDDLCFTAPFLIAAKTGDDTSWENSLRSAILDYGADVYYGDTIRMLCLIVDAGAFLVPDTAQDSQLWGDVDGDGRTGVADMVTLLHYLLGQRTLSQQQWEAADVWKDEKVNGADLTRLRAHILGEY